jgi:hypothetical protein
MSLKPIPADRTAAMPMQAGIPFSVQTNGTPAFAGVTILPDESVAIES